jgi:hypothetical protein
MLRIRRKKKPLGKLLALRTAQIILHDHEQIRCQPSNSYSINELNQEESKIISILPFLRRLCV